MQLKGHIDWLRTTADYFTFHPNTRTATWTNFIRDWCTLHYFVPRNWRINAGPTKKQWKRTDQRSKFKPIYSPIEASITFPVGPSAAQFFLSRASLFTFRFPRVSVLRQGSSTISSHLFGILRYHRYAFVFLPRTSVSSLYPSIPRFANEFSAGY